MSKLNFNVWKNMNKVVKRIISIVLILAVAGTGVFIYFNTTKNKKVSANPYAVTKVRRGNVSVTITGTGVAAPYERYDIVPLVKGKIMQAPFEEGASVKKDDVLYAVDDTDVQNAISQAQNTLDKLTVSGKTSNDNLENLSVYAKSSGRLSNFNIKVGDNVTTGAKQGDIINDKQMKVTLPFNENNVKQISIGQNATVTSPVYMISIDATVSDINWQPIASADGSITYNVEFMVQNPGGLVEGTMLTANIGGMTSAGNAALKVENTISILPESAGKVTNVYVNDGQYVSAGTKLFDMENDSYIVSSKQNVIDQNNQRLAIQNQQKQLDNYYIKSPISGTVILKTYKTGDTINTGTSSVILMTVADLSKLKFTMSVDELDIAKIKLEQKVAVTADALPNENFEGKITNIATEGQTSNGVTTYKVEVVIDKPGNLKPSMNVNATVTLDERLNVVRLSVGDATKVGNQYFVAIKLAPGETVQPSPTRMPNPSSTTTPSSDKKANGTQSSGSANRTQSNNSTAVKASQLPQGFTLKKIDVGLVSNSYIEVTKGLNEGDEILSLTRAINPDSTNNQNGIFGGMPNPMGSNPMTGNTGNYGGQQRNFPQGSGSTSGASNATKN